MISTSSSDVKNLNRMDVSYPLGLGYLGAVLEREGYDTQCLDLYCIDWNTAKDRFIKTIVEYNPDFVCLSCLTMNRWTTYEAINLIKLYNPTAKIVVGGCHATCMDTQMLLTLPIDVIVKGEGERTIIEVLDALKNHKNLDSIDGISWLDESEFPIKKVHKTNQREFIKDLDSLPFPKHEYFKDIIEKTKHAYIMAQRGCPFKCSFCSTSLHWGNVVRRRSPQNVVNEIQYLINTYDVTQITFMDDTFNLNPVWVIDVCKEILKREIKCSFSAFGRVYPLPIQMLHYMKQAGFNNMGFGVESGSSTILKEMRKTFTKEQIIEASQKLKDVGIDFSYFLIVGHPGETWDTINETISLWETIGKIKGKPLDISNTVPILWIFPNTEIYDLSKKQGIINDEYWIQEDGIRYYTGEHDLKTLQKMSNKVRDSIHLSFGYKYYIKNIAPGYIKTKLHGLKQMVSI